MNKSQAVAAIVYSTVTVSTIIVIAMLMFGNPFVVEEPTHTMVYENITGVDAKILVENETNITIADCTGGCQPCSWRHGNVPDAKWVDNYQSLYNSTDTLLIYTKDGMGSEEICKLLTGHVYGDIYNLVGGYNSWVNG